MLTHDIDMCKKEQKTQEFYIVSYTGYYSHKWQREKYLFTLGDTKIYRLAVNTGCIPPS